MQSLWLMIKTGPKRTNATFSYLTAFNSCGARANQKRCESRTLGIVFSMKNRSLGAYIKVKNQISPFYSILPISLSISRFSEKRLWYTCKLQLSAGRRCPEGISSDGWHPESYDRWADTCS